MSKQTSIIPIKFVSVGGYSLSGGTAIVDLLKEFNNFRDMGNEFRLIKDPYGIMDLEDKLFNDWRDPLNADLAIKDFYWLCKQLDRYGRKFSRAGMGYSSVLSYFLAKSESYIDNLTQFSYRGTWHLITYKKSHLLQFFTRQLAKLGLIDGLDLMYSTISDKKEFLTLTKKYINSLFLELSENGSYNILLHNGLPTTSTLQAFNYFDHVKLIIIDRDPRDIYTEIIDHPPAWFRPDKDNSLNNARIFVSDFLRRRLQQSELAKDHRVLQLKFEDLVLNYEQTIKKIYLFLELLPDNHVKKGAFFDPQISKKNIGKYKKLGSNEAIKHITVNLKDYLFTL